MNAADIDALVIDRPDDGVFQVHADFYRSEEIFELEMQHVFEGGWVFLGLSCLAPEPHGFFTAHIGRQPVIVSRDGNGALHGFLNACRHRGSLVCRKASGRAEVHVCPYHAWAYDSAGRNVGITGRDHGAYGSRFDGEDHDLQRLPEFGEYRGFLFGSLNGDVAPLEEYLGEARTFIDLAVDQSEDGLEIIPGTVKYAYDGNWKLQIENSADLYHFVPTHQTFLQILNRRSKSDGSDSPYRDRADSGVTRGSMCFPNGHNVMFGGGDKIEARPLYRDQEKIGKRVSETRLKWMLFTRNALFFPNMQLLENAAMQVRVNRPVSARRTEVTTYCVAPKGESRAARQVRIRQYEEFFNPSGLATPDDTAIFEFIQEGQKGRAVDWNLGYLRGMSGLGETPIDEARELGLSPLTSIVGSLALGDETVLHGPIREVRRRLTEALNRGRDAFAAAE